MIIVDDSEPVGEIEPPFEHKDAVVLRKDEDVHDYFDMKKEIGRGRFGTVYLCNCRKTSQKFAAKCINTKRKNERRNVEREVEIMNILHEKKPCLKLIQLYDAFDMQSEMILIEEIVDGGELFERVINEDFVLTEKACVVIVKQICMAIEYIHSKNILHLDMKPENILVTSLQGNRVKICDFGLARKYDPRKKLQVLFGTPEFVAPEVVNFEPISFGTDMWSVGVICYVLLSGLSPFLGHNFVETMTNVTKNQYDFDDEAFDEVSDQAINFIESLLILDKNERLTSTQCLRHDWIRKPLQPSTRERRRRSSTVSSTSVEEEDSCWSEQNDPPSVDTESMAATSTVVIDGASVVVASTSPIDIRRIQSPILVPSTAIETISSVSESQLPPSCQANAVDNNFDKKQTDTTNTTMSVNYKDLNDLTVENDDVFEMDENEGKKRKISEDILEKARSQATEKKRRDDVNSVENIVGSVQQYGLDKEEKMSTGSLSNYHELSSRTHIEDKQPNIWQELPLDKKLAADAPSGHELFQTVVFSTEKVPNNQIKTISSNRENEFQSGKDSLDISKIPSKQISTADEKKKDLMKTDMGTHHHRHDQLTELNKKVNELANTLKIAEDNNKNKMNFNILNMSDKISHRQPEEEHNKMMIDSDDKHNQKSTNANENDVNSSHLETIPEISKNIEIQNTCLTDTTSFVETDKMMKDPSTAIFNQTVRKRERPKTMEETSLSVSTQDNKVLDEITNSPFTREIKGRIIPIQIEENFKFSTTDETENKLCSSDVPRTRRQRPGGEADKTANEVKLPEQGKAVESESHTKEGNDTIPLKHFERKRNVQSNFSNKNEAHFKADKPRKRDTTLSETKKSEEESKANAKRDLSSDETELERTKKQLKEFVDKWNSQSGSGYAIGIPFTATDGNAQSKPIINNSQICDLTKKENLRKLVIEEKIEDGIKKSENIVKELQEKLNILNEEATRQDNKENRINCDIVPVCQTLQSTTKQRVRYKEDVSKPLQTGKKDESRIRRRPSAASDIEKREHRSRINSNESSKMPPSRDVAKPLSIASPDKAKNVQDMSICDKREESPPRRSRFGKSKPSRDISTAFETGGFISIPISYDSIFGKSSEKKENSRSNTPSRRSRKLSREEKDLPQSRANSKESNHSSSGKSLRRPSRDAPMTAAQTQRLGVLDTSGCQAIEGQRFNERQWPDIRIAPNSNDFDAEDNDEDSEASVMEPITFKLELKNVKQKEVKDHLENSVFNQTSQIRNADKATNDRHHEKHVPIETFGLDRQVFESQSSSIVSRESCTKSSLINNKIISDNKVIAGLAALTTTGLVNCSSTSKTAPFDKTIFTSPPCSTQTTLSTDGHKPSVLTKTVPIRKSASANRLEIEQNGKSSNGQNAYVGENKLVAWIMDIGTQRKRLPASGSTNDLVNHFEGHDPGYKIERDKSPKPKERSPLSTDKLKEKAQIPPKPPFGCPLTKNKSFGNLDLADNTESVIQTPWGTLKRSPSRNSINRSPSNNSLNSSHTVATNPRSRPSNIPSKQDLTSDRNTLSVDNRNTFSLSTSKSRSPSPHAFKPYNAKSNVTKEIQQLNGSISARKVDSSTTISKPIGTFAASVFNDTKFLGFTQSRPVSLHLPNQTSNSESLQVRTTTSNRNTSLFDQKVTKQISLEVLDHTQEKPPAQLTNRNYKLDKSPSEAKWPTLNPNSLGDKESIKVSFSKPPLADGTRSNIDTTFSERRSSRTLPSAPLPQPKKQFSFLLFSTHDRISQFEKREEKSTRSQRPITRSKTSTNYGSASSKEKVVTTISPKKQMKSSNNENMHLDEKPPSVPRPSVVSSKSPGFNTNTVAENTSSFPHNFLALNKTADTNSIPLKLSNNIQLNNSLNETDSLSSLSPVTTKSFNKSPALSPNSPTKSTSKAFEFKLSNRNIKVTSHVEFVRDKFFEMQRMASLRNQRIRNAVPFHEATTLSKIMASPEPSLYTSTNHSFRKRIMSVTTFDHR